MHAPLIAAMLALLAFLFLVVSAFLGVTALADWTVLAAESGFVLAAIVFLGWFVVGCVQQIRRA